MTPGKPRMMFEVPVAGPGGFISGIEGEPVETLAVVPGIGEQGPFIDVCIQEPGWGDVIGNLTPASAHALGEALMQVAKWVVANCASHIPEEAP